MSEPFHKYSHDGQVRTEQQARKIVARMAMQADVDHRLQYIQRWLDNAPHRIREEDNAELIVCKRALNFLKQLKVSV